MWRDPHVARPPMWRDPHVARPPFGATPMWRDPHVAHRHSIAHLRAPSLAATASEIAENERKQGHHRQGRVNAIEHTAVAGQQGARILDPERTLHQALPQIAEH